MNTVNTVTICWQLSEHDAASVLRLLYHEKKRTNRVWQPYWQRLADNLNQAILEASMDRKPERSYTYEHSPDVVS